MITQAHLKSMLRYDPVTGAFTWLSRPDKPKWVNARLAGKEAGWIRPDGYHTIRIDGTNHATHRLAWLYVHGEWPHSEIDHIDRARRNNAISNLRIATRSLNSLNKKIASASGFRGVTWNKNAGKWQASIGGKQSYLGLFADKLDAARAYRSAAVEKYGSVARTFPGVLP